MPIYLPIAELSVDVFTILGLGGLIGFLSGLFGAGGGFLLTPALIFLGVPPAVAVATGANQIVASSLSGMLGHWRRGNVDLRMGAILTAGGLAGSAMGVGLFRWLRALGQIDLMITVSYVLVLGIVGSLMLVESLRAFRRDPQAQPPRRRPARAWVAALPFKMRFHHSRLVLSPLLPAGIGLLVGMLAAIMGVGGGFILVPAMIYLLGMPTAVVVGTSLFNIVFITASATLLQAAVNHTVDIVLALPLMLGGVIGAQVGVRAATRLKGEHLRALLALSVLGVAVKMLVDVAVPPAELFSILPAGH